MLELNSIKLLLARQDIGRRDKAVALLAAGNIEPKSIAKMREIALEAGLREAKKWNISADLARAKGLAINLPQGWEITPDGVTYLQSLGVPVQAPQIAQLAISLRSLASTVTNSDRKQFLDEAIGCLEAGFHKAACVLTWAGAVYVLQEHVFTNYLAAFNAEALRRDPKHREVKALDGFGRVKEADFLQILESIGVLGKNVKQQLEERLNLRNACGHPNSLKISSNVVAAHVEILMLNIFSKY